MITLNNGTLREVQGATMLEALAEARVFNVLVDDDQFIVEEACDYAFHVRLTRTQLRALANELLALTNNLPEEQ